jgi:menaquinone-9 beta-reductase
VLDRLGLTSAFQDLRPAPVTRVHLQFGRKGKTCPLPETASGVSRYALDGLLLEHCRRRGAELIRERIAGPTPAGWVNAAGRQTPAAKGDRLFGFKAHYSGPAHDAVELYFFRGCYVGLNCIEGGLTNVCGLGPERILRAHNFEIDEILRQFRPLRDRLEPLQRAMDWLHVGPLVFKNRFDERNLESYPAGDALSFVDPFTGSGIASALITGNLAGSAAARRTSPSEYLEQTRQALGRPFAVAGALRNALSWNCVGHLASLIPATYLFRWTRPAIRF